MPERIVTHDLQMEEKFTKFLFSYLKSEMCVRLLSHGRPQADNPFLPIPAAARHNQLLR